MGRGSILSRIICPSKAKEKERVKAEARERKEKQEAIRYRLNHPTVYPASEVEEARANVIRDKQQRIARRTQMSTVDKPFLAVNGSTVLLPNTTYPAAAATFEDIGGEQTRTWRLGDGGSVELILLGVDPKSLTDYLDAFATSCIRCVVPGSSAAGAPIFARARIVQRTTESGRALQPAFEVTKALVMSAPSFVGGLGHVSEMGEALQGAVGFARDSLATAADAGKRTQGSTSAAERRALRELTSARQQVANRASDSEFGLRDTNVCVGIAFSIAGKPDEEIGRGLWFLGDRHGEHFHRVLRNVQGRWSGA